MAICWKRPLREELKAGEEGKPGEGGGRGLRGLGDLLHERCVPRGHPLHSSDGRGREEGLDLVHTLEKQVSEREVVPKSSKHGQRLGQALPGAGRPRWRGGRGGAGGGARSG